MANYGMSVDLTSCVACGACVVACKNENNVPLGDGFERDWIVEIVEGTYPNLKAELYSNRCQHCVNAPCVSACPTQASYIKDGMVLVNRDICVGCSQCIAACPYGARYLHPEGFVDKCTFCDHRVAEGKEPACVEVCPTESLVFGDLDDPSSPIAKAWADRKFKVLKPNYGTAPKFFLLESTVEKEEIEL